MRVGVLMAGETGDAGGGWVCWQVSLTEKGGGCVCFRGDFSR